LYRGFNKRPKAVILPKNFCMNKLATWLSVLCLVLIGLLYYFHFTHVDFEKFKFVTRPVDTSSKGNNFRMAYFEMDSVDQNYEYAKFIRENLKKKEEQLNNQLLEMKKGYQRHWDEYKKKKGPVLSQADNDAMNSQYQGMLQEYNNKQKEMTDELESEKYKMYADANKKITEYLKVFNRDKGFNYIIADQANVFYYKDSLYNITQELVKGLNSQYALEKKK